MEAEDFLVINSLLYSDSDKYIWVGESLEERRNAQCLFDFLMRRNIYVKGFASRSPRLIGLRMYNKVIFDADALDETQFVFADSNFRQYTLCLEPQVIDARMINPNIKGENIFIWGAGITGDKVFQILRENGFTISGFIDSDRKKQKTLKHNLYVFAPEYLVEQGKDCIVIEALENWEEIDADIKAEIGRRFHFSFGPLLDNISCYVNGKEHKLFRLSDFWMFNRFAGKKVYIYGNGLVERAFAEYIKLMDYNFCGYLIDSEDDSAGIEGQYIEEILYEDNYYIWIYDRDRAKKLEELGLQCFVQWECNGLPWDITLNRKEGLDLNLGYTSLTDGDCPGAVVYGKDRGKNYKIAILGGSTSDGILYPFKTWGEFLYEDLREMGITIYNCGVSGYTSGQELLKLIRDVVPMKPDMILVYDGCNDLNVDIKHPFSFAYLKTVFDFARGHMEQDANIEYTQKLCEGVKSESDRFDQYLCNIRNMHAIASEHNIRFFGFCQPVLSCKKGITDEEKNILLSMPGGRVDFWVSDYFRGDLESGEDIPEYLYDFTSIFDDVDNVYMDVCHVNEKGNRIIANRVKEIIYDTIVSDMDERALRKETQ